MTQNPYILTAIISNILNAVWSAILLWGFLKSLRRTGHNEVMIFSGKLQDAVIQAKNTAIEYSYEIQHISTIENLPKQPGQFTIIVTYKTKS